MLNFKPGRKSPPIKTGMKLFLVSHLESEHISIPTLAVQIGISRFQLYNVLTGRTGCVPAVEDSIRSFIKKRGLI